MSYERLFVAPLNSILPPLRVVLAGIEANHNLILGGYNPAFSLILMSSESFSFETGSQMKKSTSLRLT